MKVKQMLRSEKLAGGEVVYHVSNGKIDDVMSLPKVSGYTGKYVDELLNDGPWSFVCPKGVPRLKKGQKAEFVCEPPQKKEDVQSRNRAETENLTMPTMEEFIELICQSSPLAWVAHNDMNGAGNWEKKAYKLLQRTKTQVTNPEVTLNTNISLKCDKCNNMVSGNLMITSVGIKVKQGKS